MNEDKRNENPQGGETKPLEEPAVLFDETFETLALSCAKANPVVCPGGNPDRS